MALGGGFSSALNDAVTAAIRMVIGIRWLHFKLNNNSMNSTTTTTTTTATTITTTITTTTITTINYYN